jgi:hypothetical protein
MELGSITTGFDGDWFRWDESKPLNVINSLAIVRDSSGKPVSTFRIPHEITALAVIVHKR